MARSTRPRAVLAITLVAALTGACDLDLYSTPDCPPGQTPLSGLTMFGPESCVDVLIDFSARFPLGFDSGYATIPAGQGVVIIVRAENQRFRIKSWKQSDPGIAMIVTESGATAHLYALQPGRTRVWVTIRFDGADKDTTTEMTWIDGHYVNGVEVVPRM